MKTPREEKDQATKLEDWREKIKWSVEVADMKMT